ncbi:MAG: MCE family protein [Gammaproteobacteria bacterium]|nr:MCE family protein [Gammaproteobacteria bacterium]
MTESDAQSAAPTDQLQLPESVVTPRSRISMVWLIPLVALLVGGWLAYKTYSEQGPTIHISFKSAGGLQAGKTKVRFKDVEIGTVTEIRVHDDLQSVLVKAELVPESESYLTERTRFWVERPRVTAGRVSGLETLLSGAYIAIDPVTDGKLVREFIGLEEPPLFTTSEQGTQFVLHSASLGSLTVGSPIYHRSIPVGQVTSYELDEAGERVNIGIFIAAPYDRLVLTNTRFWNASGLDFKLNTEGIQVDTQSLLSIFVGGIAFDNKGLLESRGKPAPAKQRFPLYLSQSEAFEQVYQEKERYLMYFDGSVRGLERGSPVMVRGIRIGKVLDVQLKFSTKSFEFSIPVLVEIEPGRIELSGDRSELLDTNVLARLVREGLRGQLKSGSLLTGQLFIDLDLYPDAAAAALVSEGDYQVIPTLPAPIDAIFNKVDEFLNRLLALPLDAISEELQTTLKGASAITNSAELQRAIAELAVLLRQIRETVSGVDKGVLPELTATLQEAQTTLKQVGGVVSENSTLYAELNRMVRELSSAARSIRDMADYLERHPEALLKGKP